MDRQYQEIYGELYKRMIVITPVPPGRVWRSRDPVEWVRSVIADIEFSAGPGSYPDKRLREDAKLFLLVNLVQMVVWPVGLSTDRLPIDLRAAVAHDASLLFRAAQPDTDGFVSAHAVVDALAQSWKNLKLSDLKIWE